MRDILDIKGASGSVYRFSRFRDGAPLSAMGGNFVYARERDGALELVFSGESENLMRDSQGRWDAAVQTHGAQHLFTRLNISERIRTLENDDILAAVVPPMNEPPVKPARRKKAD
jgi:hypothetical protein